MLLSAARDPVEAINSILRRAGHPVHCTWISSLRDLGEAVSKVQPEQLIYVTGPADELQTIVNIRDQTAPTVPIVVLADSVDEARIATAMVAGARDVVT